MSNLLIKDIAKDLGIPRRTVQNYCKTGYLPAIKSSLNGVERYEVEQHVYFRWKKDNFDGVKRGNISKHNSNLKHLSLEELDELSIEWLDWAQTGKLTGKPLSPRTIEIYDNYYQLYIKRLSKYPKKPLISLENLRNVLGTFKPEQFSTKRNTYDAIMSLSKFLIEKKLLKEKEREEFKRVKPRMYIPPKRTSVTEKQLELMYRYIESMMFTSWEEKLTSKTLILFLAHSGLRASEFCNLKLEDVDLETRRIYVNLGKGNKNRIVGIDNENYEQLREYLKYRLTLSENASLLTSMATHLL